MFHSRKWYRRLLLGLLLLTSSLPIAVSSQEATPEPLVLLVGRFTTDTAVTVSPNGPVQAEVQQGSEFATFADDRQESNGEMWIAVYPLRDATRGWVRIEDTELAESGSTPALRRYADGFCYATPQPQRLPGARIVDRYQHGLYFVPEVPVFQLMEIGDFSLLFNDQPRNITLLVDEPDNGFLLPASWVLRHSGPLPPTWQDGQYWTLVYPCDELVLSNH